MQFDGVAGVVTDLLSIEDEHLAILRGEALHDVAATTGRLDQIESDQSEVRANAHHDVGVIDRDAALV